MVPKVMWHITGPSGKPKWDFKPPKPIGHRINVKRGYNYRGVFFRDGKWTAYHTLDSKRTRTQLGLFETEEEAAKAYDDYWFERFGTRPNESNERDLKLPRPPGVSWHRHKKRWVAAYSINGKAVHLGTYETMAEAAKAYETKFGKVKGFSSRQVGVSFRQDRKKWRAEIRVDKKYINLGTFKTEEEAIQARLRAERKLAKNLTDKLQGSE